MEINTLLHEKLHAALKNNDVNRKSVIRLLMLSVKLAEVAKGSEINQMEFLSIIQKEIKTRHDTIADAQKANRAAMIETSNAEIKILEEFLPKQITEQEIITLAQEIIEETGAQSPKDMGRVMQLLILRLEGRASNQEASRVVKELLQKN